MVGGDVQVTGVGTALTWAQEPADLLRPERWNEPGTDPARRLTGRGHRYKDRATRLGLVAARAALRDGGVFDGDRLNVSRDDFGVVVSSNLGNIDTVCEAVRTIAAETYAGTSPMLLPNTSSNVIASWIAIAFGLRGANLTLCNGPSSGLDAVQWARLLIRVRRVRRALVVGVEPANPPVRRFAAGDDPAPRLFDGAAAVLLEEAGAAALRDARPLAVVGNYARRTSHQAAVRAVVADSPAIRLWCPPEGGFRSSPEARPDLRALPRWEPQTRGGSGALGVLQCAAGTAWLAAGGGGAVLATAGVGGDGPGTGTELADDASAALVLHGVSRR